MKYSLKDSQFPEQLKSMSFDELTLLSYEIRDFLLEHVSKTGGHLASNLGVVELTIALHSVFDSPRDKIIWDVGHQSYVHKILTGRADKMDTLRQLSGISGFTRTEESCHDMYDSGHSSTSISAALGYAAARDLDGEDYSVLAVIGDGALTGGVAYEAMNNAGHNKSPLIVILNDNEMSISENVGGMSHHLSRLRVSDAYRDFKKTVKSAVSAIPGIGKGIYSGMEHLRDSLKYAIIPGAIFEEMGFKYLGPIDGHNVRDLVEVMEQAKHMKEPVMIHVVTKKGKGYRNAENHPEKFHGVAPFDSTTGNILNKSTAKSYSEIFGDTMIQLAVKDPKIVAISAAMLDGTGLNRFSERFPSRTFDVGIAEQHAVTFAAGLALNGYKPVVAIYSTFLQRAYDQVIIDVCMQNLPVVFAIDRAGNVGADGCTHNGQFDLSYLNHMPNLTILAPRNGEELSQMLEHAVSLPGPCAIRYPRGSASSVSPEENEAKPLNGTCEVLKTGSDILILSAGSMADSCLKAADILQAKGISAQVTSARYVKPLDEEGILNQAEGKRLVVTVEDNTVEGGFGSLISALISQKSGRNSLIPVLRIGWPDQFVQHGSTERLVSLYGLDPAGIAEKVEDFFERQT